ncbi:hypothetical protein C8F01DRAFT_26887 [Mycena amicta]|nr:hypothetical protein C8F01DRAFT_26887 [Mycena amicta]
MGRWTVEEWQAQMELDPPFPGEKDMDDEYVDEEEYEDGHYYDYTNDDSHRSSIHKPLPLGPRAYDELPPIPPSKTTLPSAVTVRPPTPPHESVVHRIFDAVRGRSRSNSRSTVNVDTTPEVVDKYRIQHHQRLTPIIMSPTGSSPRSPASGRRQFHAHTGLKRTKSKSMADKLKSKAVKAAPALASETYTYGASRGALKILVSTQTTETHSAHDAARPRVFYPRSSSLVASAELAAAAAAVQRLAPRHEHSPGVMRKPSPPLPLPPPSPPATQAKIVTPAQRMSSIPATAPRPVAARPGVRPLPVPVPRPLMTIS